MDILIVDDSNFILNKLKNFLCCEFNNLNCFIALDGFEAIEIFKTQKIDILILDLIMPNLTGVELIKKVRKIDTSVGIIVISADIQKKTKDRVLEYNILKFINKPLNKEKMIEISGLMSLFKMKNNQCQKGENLC